jgi:hypothetical protein
VNYRFDGLAVVSTSDWDEDALRGPLDRYLRGEERAEDAAALESWVAGRPAARQELESLRTVVRAPFVYPLLADADAMWAAMARRIELAPPARRQRRAPVWVRGWVPIVGTIAAALVVAVMLARRPAPIERVASVPVGELPLGAIPDTEAAPTSPPQPAAEKNSGAVVGNRSHNRTVASGSRELAEDSLDVARAPYAGTPFNDNPNTSRGEASARETSLADDAPGAADTHWP